MKKNLLSILIVILICLSTNILAQDPPPPPPPELNYLKEVKKHEAEYLKNMSAAMKANLEVIKELNEEKYLQLLNEARFSSSSWSSYFPSRVRKNDNAIMELEIQSQALSIKYKSNKGNKAEIKKELTRTLEKLLDLKEKRRNDELKLLETKIKELKKSIEVRKKNKNEIIRRRVMDMLGESDYYEWD